MERKGPLSLRDLKVEETKSSSDVKSKSTGSRLKAIFNLIDLYTQGMVKNKAQVTIAPDCSPVS